MLAHIGRNNVFDSPVTTEIASNTYNRRGQASISLERREERHTLQGRPIGSVYHSLATRIKFNYKRLSIGRFGDEREDLHWTRS